ncbi:MAG: hypothetical protein JOZ36_03260 [Acidobacteria bacterium]|nr:hypothetical protein [Acidobacteriota bacterium]
MERMIDLIRKSAVSATIMQAAARGALLIPADEMIEILVHLANHNKSFGAQARMRLAGWDLTSARAVAGNPRAPEEVLRYMIAEDNLRPNLLPTLLENPAVPEECLAKLARIGSGDVVKAMSQSSRVNQSPKISKALGDNPNYSSATASCPTRPTAPLIDNPPAQVCDQLRPENAEIATSTDGEKADSADAEVNEQIAAFMAEHATEIAAEAQKPYQAVSGLDSPDASTAPTEALARVAPGPGREAAVPAAAKSYYARGVEASKRDSTLQKIAKLEVKGRIQLAMKGSKEERSILIRDGTKLVALAVLDSPKITDSEVESFATQKNVLEAVLRGIAMKRRFAKNYPVIRNLVFNPRTPIDLSLALMKNLLVNDLKHLSGNKEVSDTIRKLALKMFKQKMESKKGG